MNKPEVIIAYCPRCNWMLRAAWMAQEILSGFWEQLAKVSLVPAEEGGHFSICVGDREIWERKRDGGFPNPKELKQRVRDVLDPERDLGHAEGP